ncbi:unnamed protein product [Prunus armeniaca]|uniref:NB-ARC domain-containing protein n=1 Tax=Prunus armeniaca TaxID=36596 RepID=A0A6J5TJP9_PRUAR|nr:unnamed protein product [Prunus armeniaca]
MGCKNQLMLPKGMVKLSNSDVQSWLQKRTFNNNVAHPAPPPMIWSTFKEGFKDFKSRMTYVNSAIERKWKSTKLYRRLKQINKIPIVLDDVWTELDFEAMDFLMDLIKVLTPEESWELFREIIGKPLDYPDLAKRVTNECAGLPIAILTLRKH